MKQNAFFVTAWLFAIIGLCALVGSVFRNCSSQSSECEIPIERKVIYDTIQVSQPIAAGEREIEMRVERVPTIFYDTVKEKDTVVLRFCDTVETVLPITQKEYRDNSYRAYVSGYKPNLDSIFIVSKRETLTPKEKMRRWSIGMQAGYGLSLQKDAVKLAPYIGVGLSYNLISF